MDGLSGFLRRMLRRFGEPSGARRFPAAGAERRAQRRGRTPMRSGKLVDRGNRHLVDCRIRDSSGRGRTLALLAPLDAPEDMRFFEDESRTLWDIAVIWRRGAEMGIRLRAPVERGGRGPSWAALGQDYYALR